MKNRYAIFILTSVMAVLLPSCAYNDPAFLQLKEKCDTNPSPNGIVGAWRRPEHGYGGSRNMNLLFREGGKGHSYITDFGEEGVGMFTWKFAGNGVWTSSDLWGYIAEIRITKDSKNLLIKQTGLGGSTGTVYVRQ